jgi:tRNA(Leu) C34 or U34 (ribose-2'-O)-methylase TrmL
MVKYITDTTKAHKSIPMLYTDDLRTTVPYDCVPVAVEFTEGWISRSLLTYCHPERAFYVFGPEDGSIASEVMAWCRDKVWVPTNRCMNLSGCVHVVLYDRMLKSEQSRMENERKKIQDTATP